MPVITLHLEEMVEERERRRARKALALAAAIALVGVLSMRPTDGGAAVAPAADTVRPEAEAADGPPPAIERVAPGAHRVCVTPQRIDFTGDGSGAQRVTVWNPGTSPVTVTDVRAVSDRAVTGFAVDATGCIGKRLGPGRHCTIAIALRQRIGETVELRVADDTGGAAETIVIRAAERSAL